MTRPQYPVKVNLTAKRASLVTDERRRSVYRGDTYSDTLTIYDSSGVPFNLQYSTGSLNWTIRATFRDGEAPEGGSILSEATCSASDPTNGGVTFTFPPAQTCGVDSHSGYWDLEIENITDPRFSAGETYTAFYGTVDFYGDVSRSETLEPGTNTVSGSEEALDGLANLTSEGASIPGETEHGVYSTETGGVAYLRGIVGTEGLRALQTGESIRIGRRPNLIAPVLRRPMIRYPAQRFWGRKTAGSANVPTSTTCADVHAVLDTGYPYQVWTATDYYGHPHAGHQYTESTQVQPYTDSGTYNAVNGALAGYRIEHGDFKRGSKMRWTLNGTAQNVTYPDAFWDFCLDINPSITASAYVTTNRMRMLSPELGVTWAGEVPWWAEIELFPLDATTCRWRWNFKVYDRTGPLLVEWDGCSDSTHGFDWMDDDANIQLRWRVDRTLLTRTDTFDDTNQGTNQGTDYIRCHVDSYELEPIGFGGSI